MKQITLKGEDKKLNIFIDGKPNFKALPEEDLMVLATVFENIISRRYEQYIKRKECGKKQKKSS